MTLGIEASAAEPQAAAGTTAPAHAPGSEEEAFLLPMTPLQKRLWRAGRARPGSSAHNGAFRVEIAGPLRLEVLADVVATLGRRHEILNAACAEIDGVPHLVVRPDLKHRLGVVDFKHLPVTEAEAAMERHCAAVAKCGFDLEAGPLAAFELIEIERERAILTLTFHQMIIDGWSVSLLLDELPKLYEAILAKNPARVPLPALQFGDYAAWLDETTEAPATRVQVAEAARRLGGYRRLDIIPDVAAGGDVDASAIIARTLARDLVESIQAYCAADGATMFSVSLAACLAVLSNVSGRADVSVGSPLAGRSRPELENVVGPLVNYAILRADIAADTTLGSLERTCRDAALDAVTSQALPLEQVLDHLAAAGTAVSDPAYSIAFVSQRGFAGTTAVTHEFAGCRMRTLPSLTQGSLHDLFFFLVERETGWRLAVEYATSKFSDALANDLLDAFVEVLSVLVRTPGESLAALATPAVARLAERGQGAEAAYLAQEACAVEGPADTEGDTDGGPFLVPASLTQERFHLLAQAAPESPGFNMPACLRIRGPLSYELLARSLAALVERQEILRTSFTSHEGTLHQAISPSIDVPLPFTDLSATAPADREVVARTESRTDALTPFDLTEAPLLRARLLRFADDDHVLILVVHHIVSDGQSMGLLQRELWALYEGLAAGAPAALSPLAIQYADFAVSQREWITSDLARAQLDFWAKTLSGPLPVADFPLDRAPAFGAQAGTALEVEALPRELVAALVSFAAKNSTTMFAVTGAAFSALVARYCNRTDILFGCPVANRTADTAEIMGPFAGPLAIRVALDGDPTVADIVSRVSDSSLDSMANAAVPFEKIIERCDARSVEGRSPLFQFYFLYQKAFLQPLSLAGLEVLPLPTISVGTPYELQLALIERSEGVSLQLEYNPALLDRETVRGIVAYYINVLQVLASGSASRLSELPAPLVSATAHRLGQADQRRRLPFTPARTALERTLTGIWTVLLKHDPIGVHDDFFALGGQSILAARLVVEVKRVTGATISVSTIAFARTIAELAEVIESGDGSRQSPRLIPMRTAGDRVPLFLVHCGGGHVLRYQDLLATLPEDQPVYGLSAPPLEGADDSVSVESLARLYVEEIRKVQPRGPYQIGGYSFGGLVAYEIARLLAEAGESVPLVAIFDTLNRAAFKSRSLASRAMFNAAYVADRLDRYRSKLASGNFSGFAESAAWAVRRRLGGVRPRARQNAAAVGHKPEPELPPDNLALFDTLSDHYAPRPFAGNVLVFHAQERGAEYRATPMLGWDAVAANVEVAYVPGDHMSFIKKPNVGSLVAQLQAFLERARAPAGVATGGSPGDRHARVYPA